jgi:hypothetical protein
MSSLVIQRVQYVCQLMSSYTTCTVRVSIVIQRVRYVCQLMSSLVLQRVRCMCQLVSGVVIQPHYVCQLMSSLLYNEYGVCVSIDALSSHIETYHKLNLYLALPIFNSEGSLTCHVCVTRGLFSKVYYMSRERRGTIHYHV